MPATSSPTSASPRPNSSGCCWRNTVPRGDRAARAPILIPRKHSILKTAPELADYLAALKQRSHKLVVFALRQLLRLVREYPREPLLAAVREAARYGLYDLDRVERMILRRVARDYFLLDDDPGGNDEAQ